MGSLFTACCPSSSSSSSNHTASVSMQETVDGSHLFTIRNYSITKGIGIGKRICSSTFNVGGHDWFIGVYLDGYDKDDADFVSVHLMVRGEPKDTRMKFTLSLLDPSGVPVFSQHYSRTCKAREYGWGSSRFIERNKLETPTYLKDDCIAIMCKLSVIQKQLVREVPKKTSSVLVPPTNLHNHLLDLLESGVGTDVAFQVGGKLFLAHGCVLAARSPVFMEELLGSMKEGPLPRIEIDDMEAMVFEALLHFIYSDSLPQIENPSTTMAQNLLVAADRYGLERLRLMCEDKLCKDMDVSTVASTLALAEQRRCLKLKSACFDFIASREILVAVMLTEGFEHLKRSCPSVAKEITIMHGKPNLAKYLKISQDLCSSLPWF
ncbi:BTB/POZ and MATH domain-containing protein 1-like [Typha angustifolia]|uniref:BTB/POZ and MATH domain-containing protein 1-like n=1 Tax=Typha angustifolia TaxID=59011 RepID=UPI003C2D7858